VTFFVGLLTFFSALGGLLFGYDTGVIAGALLAFHGKFELSRLEKELVVAMTLVGALLGALCGGPLADSYGRRPMVIVGSIVYFCGGMLLALAPDKQALIVGRLVVGVAVGISSQSVPVYIAEHVPSSLRGPLVTFFQLFITIGILIAACVDYALTDSRNWRLMFGISVFPAALQFIGMLCMPETPRWLVSKGRIAEAAAVLRMSRRSHTTLCTTGEEDREGNTDGGNESDVPADLIAAELAEIEASVRGGGSSSSAADTEDVGAVWEFFRAVCGGGGWDSPSSDNNSGSSGGSGSSSSVAEGGQPPTGGAIRHALMVGTGLMVLSQFQGINTVIYYAPTILKFAGLCDKQAILGLIAIDAVNVVMTLVSVALIERLGRRTWLLLGSGGMLGSLLMLSFSFTMLPDGTSATSGATSSADGSGVGFTKGSLATVSLALYVAFFAASWGPIGWLYNSEIYPTSVR
jgi:SP family myo-inositol transporter-like MFS transporter 13